MRTCRALDVMLDATAVLAALTGTAWGGSPPLEQALQPWIAKVDPATQAIVDAVSTGITQGQDAMRSPPKKPPPAEPDWDTGDGLKLDTEGIDCPQNVASSVGTARPEPRVVDLGTCGNSRP